MNWAMSGGSNRLVLVPSLSTFPTNTYTEKGEESAKHPDDGVNAGVTSPHVIAGFALRSIHGERPPIQTRRHLEGFDILSTSDATGTLCRDSR